MVLVDRVYQRVLTLANKEQRGYITPQEFNLFANQAQMDIFEQYFYDLNQFLRTPGNNTMHADMVDTVNSTIQVAGRTFGNLDIDYIQSPRDVNWTYVVVGEKALYNATAIDRQDFDLHPSEETELVLKILSLAGFTLKDPNLYSAAAAEDAKNIQQEKQ